MNKQKVTFTFNDRIIGIGETLEEAGCFVWYSEPTIILNWEKIRNKSIEHDVSVDAVLNDVISHEMIHFIIERDVDIKTSFGLDKLKQRYLNKYGGKR